MASSLINTQELKAFVVDEGHGVKGLSELQIKTIPDFFIQPVEERLDMSKVVPNESIPLIDMSNVEDPKVMKSICDAAEKWGVFQIVNHGLPINVLEDVKEATRQFFALPADEKKKYLFKNSPTNNVSLISGFAPDFDKALEWKDCLGVRYVSDDEAMAFWPSLCRDQALNFMKKCDQLIKKLLEVLMKGLGMSEIDETNEGIMKGARQLLLNYYPVCPNPDLTHCIGGHCDLATLNVLVEDQTGGLYVRKFDSDNWVHVPPITGSLTINFGDALEILSNGRYKAIEHRVRANGHENCISVAMVARPRPDDVIGPLPQVLKGGEKPKYTQVLYSDYLNRFPKLRKGRTRLILLESDYST